MLSKEIICDFLTYHYAMYDRIWKIVLLLTDSQYYQELEYSRGSIHEQMFHSVATDRAWHKGILSQPRKPRLNLIDFPTRSSVYNLYKDVSAEMNSYLYSITQNELDRVPEKFFGPVWQVLLHLVNHGTDHRSQILRQLHDFGVPTFEQDYILWKWKRK